MFGQTYADVIERDRPVCWWRIGSGTATPNVVAATNTTVIAPTGSGSNLPYGGPRLDGSMDGTSSHCVGTSSAAGQGWATSSAHELPSASYSMEIWAFAFSTPSDNSTVMVRYNKTTSAADRFAVAFYVTNTRDIRFTTQSSLSTNRIDTGADGFVLRRWNHIVAVIDGTVGNTLATVWVNGKLIRSQQSPHDASGTYFTGVGMSAIAPLTSTNFRSWPGFLAEPAIYPYPLSPSQVFAHYQAGLTSRQRTLPLYPLTAPAPTPGGLTAIGDVTNRRIALVSDRPR